MKTTRTRPGEAERNWVIFDASDKVLGRLAADIATVLQGRNKPTWQPDIEMGDFVVVINADKIRVTGKKLDQKFYHHHSGHVGGLKSISLRDQKRKHPERPLEHAVRGMLPKNRLRSRWMTRLHVYTGEEHPHGAQKPKPVESCFGYVNSN